MSLLPPQSKKLYFPNNGFSANLSFWCLHFSFVYLLLMCMCGFVHMLAGVLLWSCADFVSEEVYFLRLSMIYNGQYRICWFSYSGLLLLISGMYISVLSCGVCWSFAPLLFLFSTVGLILSVQDQTARFITPPLLYHQDMPWNGFDLKLGEDLS